MSASKVVPADAKDEFWAVVEDCLGEFHGMRQAAVRRKTGKLRNRTENMTASEQEYFYHSEPFDVACEIAGSQLNSEDYRDRYLHIRDEKHGNGVSNQMAHYRRKVKN